MPNSNVYTVFGSPTSDSEFVAANLAATFAVSGYNTVLIAADPTTSFLQRLFGVLVSDSRSLKNALSAPIAGVAVDTGIEHLSLVAPADNVLAIDYDYLTNIHAQNLISEASRSFDRVVVSGGSSLSSDFAAGALACGTAVVPYRLDTRSLAWLLSHSVLIQRLADEVEFLLVQERAEFSEGEFAEFSDVNPSAKIRLGDTSRMSAKPLAAMAASVAGERIRRTFRRLLDEKAGKGDMNGRTEEIE